MKPAPGDETALQALSDAGAMCGVCGDEPGDRTCPDCEACRLRYLAALRAAGWAPATELQQQIDHATRELAAIKRDLTRLQTGRTRTSLAGDSR